MTRDKIISEINSATIETMTAVAERFDDIDIDDNMETISGWAERIRQMVPDSTTDMYTTIETLESAIEDILPDNELGQYYHGNIIKYLDRVQMVAFHDAVRQCRKS